MPQHNHHTSPFPKNTHPLIVVCDTLQSPANIGAVFRLCDAFGVAEVIFNQAIDFSSNRLRRTARNTEMTVKHTISKDIPTTISSYQKKGYVVVALEISENSVPVSAITSLAKNKTILVIGNERNGISERILELANHVVHITMHGTNSSMNVAQATAIALYELTKP